MKAFRVVALLILSTTVFTLDPELIKQLQELVAKGKQQKNQSRKLSFSEKNLLSAAPPQCPDSNISRQLTGYPFESHDVVTEDGYILKLHRIQAKGTQIKSGLPPVILQHGLVSDSGTFIINDEDKAIGRILANHGFDVVIIQFLFLAQIN